MKDKKLIIFIWLIFVLTFDFFMAIYNKIDYEKRKASGNERWEQVEEIINGIDERVKELEKDARNS